MGPGEDYFDRFYQWFSALTLAEQEAFAAANPPPAGWQLFYQGIQSSPWL
ncbi:MULTISPECIES: hypothetical protein [unclassified Sphingomonas]|nr:MULTISPECIES: hypothetical protein [unclassified Sphingomonas]MCR5870556.1 hypothetical protein [Sphingomonas sp. J344]UUY01099.1 hypothetical protein LRS08_08705 [Sphingomonas sp. J315]